MPRAGEDLGGRHHGALPAGLMAQGDGAEGDGGLAAAHVPLHQPAHGGLLPEVGGDFAQDAPLRAGGREGEALPVRVLRAFGDSQRDARFALAPGHGQGRLEHQHLFKGQAPPGQLQGLEIVGEVRLADGVVQFAQAVAQAQAVGEGLRAAAVHRGQGPLHDLPEALRRDAFHGPVHRQDLRPGDHGGVLQGAASVLLGQAAVEHDRPAHGQVLHHPGLVEPDQGQAAVLRAEAGCDPGQAAERAELRRVLHHPRHQAGLSGDQGHEGLRLRPVLIAQRQGV